MGDDHYLNSHNRFSQTSRDTNYILSTVFRHPRLAVRLSTHRSMGRSLEHFFSGEYCRPRFFYRFFEFAGLVLAFKTLSCFTRVNLYLFDAVVRRQFWCFNFGRTLTCRVRLGGFVSDDRCDQVWNIFIRC